VLERFSDDARVVILHAQEECRQLGHDSLGVEHLLLGVVRTDPALVPATEDDIRAQVVAQLPAGTGRVEGRPPFTNGAKGALERSLTAALQRGDAQIAPEHLLIALLADERVATILRGCGDRPPGPTPA
jgi:ATP-dependent Clp protease ATP-binding subunit ClpA